MDGWAGLQNTIEDSRKKARKSADSGLPETSNCNELPLSR